MRFVVHSAAIHALRKAGGATLGLDDAVQAPSVTWQVGAFTCEYREPTPGLGVLTVTGVSLPIPLHEVVVGGLVKARAKALPICAALAAGRAPPSGVFVKPHEQATRGPKGGRRP